MDDQLMTTWHTGELAPFDTESTGVDTETARVVTATVAHIRPGAEPEVSSHLVAVDVDIPAEATAVHGITTEHARANGKPAVEVLDAVAAHLTEVWANGIPVVGMNLAYDFTLLDRELRRNGLPVLEDRLGRAIGPIVDVFVIDKAVDRYRPGGRKLTDLCATYGVKLGGAHDATEDALGAARVAFRIGQRARQALADPLTVQAMYAGRRYPDRIVRGWQALGRMSLAELHQAQARWYAEQAESFAAYLRREAHEIDVKTQRHGVDADTRETGVQEAEELRRRADEITGDWPLRPWAATS